jgi:hypothetical protein
MKAMSRQLVLLAAALAAGSCTFDPYCLDCPDRSAAILDDAGNPLRDGGGLDGGTPLSDGGPSSCLPGTPEQCNGLDEDCDGTIDEQVQAVGGTCSSNVGECREGITACQDGKLACTGGVVATAELCDGKDNDCNGVVDNGNPQGGSKCGTDQGDCVSGTTVCENGGLRCIDEVLGTSEACDGRDNDCDGAFDEGIVGNSCGLTEEGECRLGQEVCVGGQLECQGAVNPTLELCDELDQDCDGNTKNGFDLTQDVRNCGSCGHVCSAPHAVSRCTGSTCGLARCEPNYWDLVNGYADGCEYGPCTYQGPQEACNKSDDDCDGTVDEGLIVPAMCDGDGACAGTVALCGQSGWYCPYGSDVETDQSGAIIPETRCDDIDNDCDGKVDEAFPLKDDPCDDGERGVCRGTGTYQCDPNDSSRLVCVIPQGQEGGQPQPEQCDNEDDDCDGRTDEDAAQDWVNLGSFQIFAYEASRPDATGSSAGSASAAACSRSGVVPWSNVTHPQAEAACATIGARLCTETEWQTACQGPAKSVSSTKPFTETASGYVVIEAEDYDANTPASAPQTPGGCSSSSPPLWITDTSRDGYVGTGAMLVSPDCGRSTDSGTANTNYTRAPQLAFNIDFVKTGTHYVWVRGYAEDGSSDSVYVGFDYTPPSTGQGPVSSTRITGFTQDAWSWRGVNNTGARHTIDVSSTGTHTLQVWMREDGFRLDRIVLTTDAGYDPRTDGSAGPDMTYCRYSQSPACYFYESSTCNGNDRDADGNTSNGDQDAVADAGELSACYTDWSSAGKIYDLSGNLKEWTAERSAGVNPLRGGSYNNISTGMRCTFAGSTASDSFSFVNVGFRCCR